MLEDLMLINSVMGGMSGEDALDTAAGWMLWSTPYFLVLHVDCGA